MRLSVFALVAILGIGTAAALTLGPISLDRLGSAQHDPVYWNELGYMLSQEGDLDAAQDAFLQAVLLDPSYENARKNLYVAAFQQGEYLTAQEHLRVLLERSESAQYHFDYAQALVAWAREQATDADAAVAALEEALGHLEAAGDYPHARKNAAVVRDVLEEALSG